MFVRAQLSINIYNTHKHIHAHSGNKLVATMEMTPINTWLDVVSRLRTIIISRFLCFAVWFFIFFFFNMIATYDIRPFHPHILLLFYWYTHYCHHICYILLYYYYVPLFHPRNDGRNGNTENGNILEKFILLSFTPTYYYYYYFHKNRSIK